MAAIKANGENLAGHDEALPTEPMNIVFVAPFGLRHKSTVWARTLPIAQSLVATGHHATILIPPWDSPEDAGKVESIGGVLLQQLSLQGGTLGTVRRLIRTIDTLSPHIVHIVKPRAHAGLVQWWLWHRRNMSAKIVLDVDDWEQAWNEVNHYNWIVAQFLTWQEEWGIRHAAGITTASRWLELKVAKLAPQIPRLYLPNGVSPVAPSSIIQPTTLQDGPQILFFTRFIEVEPKWLNEFWRTFQVIVPTAQLVIAGTPVQPWLAEAFQHALEPLTHVRWLGYVPSGELSDLYANAACAIFPAMPIPLLQAKCSVRLATTLLHGVPAVASAVGEHVSYGAEGAARLVPAEATAVDFAQAVAQHLKEIASTSAINSTTVVSDRVLATERLLTRYDWSRLTAPLPAFYELLLRQG